MNKVYTIIWLLFFYLFVSLVVWITSDTNKMWEDSFLSNTFADIFFDGQNSSTWYNSNNPVASASVTPSNIILPPPPPPVSRHSH